jgi:hypothetical protein
MKSLEVFAVQRPSKMRRYEKIVIGFSNNDYAGVLLPHTDALVVMLAIANHRMHRILVDTGSAADILNRSTFDLMKIDQGKLVPARCPLVGFAGEQVMLIGSIELQVTAGTPRKQKIIMVKFLVVDGQSAYNAILDRIALNELKVVTSIPHLCMKFLTNEGVRIVNGDQKAARVFYNASLKGLPKRLLLARRPSQMGNSSHSWRSRPEI